MDGLNMRPLRSRSSIPTSLTALSLASSSPPVSGRSTPKLSSRSAAHELGIMTLPSDLRKHRRKVLSPVSWDDSWEDKPTIKCEMSPPPSPRSLRLEQMSQSLLSTSQEDGKGPDDQNISRNSSQDSLHRGSKKKGINFSIVRLFGKKEKARLLQMGRGQGAGITGRVQHRRTPIDIPSHKQGRHTFHCRAFQGVSGGFLFGFRCCWKC
ncbi:UNVERIFIED_CONTAM: hypothetical protein FKN15_021487 [Acipenser sinensis]